MVTILMPTALNQALGALLEFRLKDWDGLPPCVTSEIASIFGAAETATGAYLGAYPAICETYPAPNSAAGGLLVYSRAQRVIAVETAEPPPVEAMMPLGDPDIRKPPEFSLAGYSVRESLYFRRGLVLSVAEALNADVQPRVMIARCRGIRALTAAHEYGAEYYLALKNRVLFEET